MCFIPARGSTLLHVVHAALLALMLCTIAPRTLRLENQHQDGAEREAAHEEGSAVHTRGEEQLHAYVCEHQNEDHGEVRYSMEVCHSRSGMEEPGAHSSFCICFVSPTLMIVRPRHFPRWLIVCGWFVGRPGSVPRGDGALAEGV